MFEFLFKYPPTVFAKGEFVFLSRLPVWVLVLAILAVGVLLGWLLWRRRGGRIPALDGLRWAALWLLQAAMAALLLIMLWQPAISISTLKPQQNIVAVMVDDSRSMALREDGTPRIDSARSTLDGGLLADLGKKFQVRLYRFGDRLDQVQKTGEFSATLEATRIGDALKQMAAEAASLPIGAVVLLSDGADNTGGVDRETLTEVRRRRIPVHTIGFGREKFDRDIEIADAVLPARTLADSRVSADVTLHQRGFEGRKVRLTVSENGKPLASQEVALSKNGSTQTESVLFNAGIAGAKTLAISIDRLDGEENQRNNSVMRLINVEAAKPRILYIEGDPRWELKFIRRALEEDRNIRLTSILRTTQNKFYRQGIEDPKELEQGFPATAEELFGYQGLIIGDVEVAYFTPAQQAIIRLFADRRGGGILFQGGRAALSDGGWASSPLADLIPVKLPDRKNTFHRDPAKAELTLAGRDSLICRLVETPDQNVERWKKLPALADYQETGEPKPGALVLAAAVAATGAEHALLATENYGLGRTALFATGGSWRWQMLQEHKDLTHETFWQQLARWLVNGAPSQVSVSTPRQLLSDEGHIKFRAVVRDKAYVPLADARIDAHVLGADGNQSALELNPSQNELGVYEGEWTADKPGSYLVEVVASRGGEALGRDVLTFRRENGVAEDFHTEQNRELLEKISEETAGRYFRPGRLEKLSEEVSYSEAGITTRELRDLWDMPVIFVFLLMLRAAEWLLRRKWGAV
jgi:uncharacterized membrane protein